MTEPELPEGHPPDETIVGDSFIEAIVGAGAMAPMPERIGDFKILGELGRGGMGVVYEAEDELLARRVAIKALPAAFARHQVALERFEREARVLASMNHPSIGAIYGVREVDRNLYLILELISGETLDERVERGALSVADTVEICVQIALAVEGAHERGVIHRDLKPENVMITDEGKIKVLDFGLALNTLLGDPGAPHSPGEEELEGTPAYMSPEQVSCEEIDERADVWGLGCILFECLTGHRAFDDADVWAVLEHILISEPRWSRLPANLPGELADLVRGCLARKIEDRVPSIAEVRRLLQASVASTAPLAQRTNLPADLPLIVGREDDMAQVMELLAEARIVTLTGTGGCGKTALATALGRQLLHSYADGVWLVELATIADSGRVSLAVARALGIETERGSPPLEAVIAHLANRTALLIVDNCEHVLQSCSDVITSLLTSCGGLTVLATSREGLGIRGAVTFGVPSLAAPRGTERITVQDVARFPAVQLFIDRALAVAPDTRLTEDDLQIVAKICRRLDGIPLAIELAAARARAMPLERIAQLLADRFHLLVGRRESTLPRQQTLRALIDWSYDQLELEEKQLLRGLGVFRGSFTLDAAVAVHGGDDPDEFRTLDLLTRLVEKSLVQTEERQHELAYRLLETIRQYAVDRMQESGESKDLRGRHLRVFAELTREATQHYDGPQAVTWARRLEREHENLREALRWAASDPGLGNIGLQMALSLTNPWAVHGHLSDGREALTDALANVQNPEQRELASSMDGLARFDLELGDLKRARERQERAVDLWRELGDQQRLGMSLSALGNVLWRLGELDAAEAALKEAMELTRNLERSAARLGAVRNLAIVAYRRRDLREGERLIDLAIQEARALDDREALAGTLQLAGVIQMRLERFEQARALHEEAMHLMEELGFKSGVAMQLINLGNVAISEEDLDAAEELYSQALTQAREVGRKMTIVEALGSLAECRDARGDAESAFDVYRQVLELCREMGETQGMVRSLERLALLAVTTGNLEAAEDCSLQRVRLLHECGMQLELGIALRDYASLAERRGDLLSAVQLLALAEGPWAQVDVPDEARASSDALRNALRQALGDERFDGAWAHASSTSIDELMSR